MCLSWLTPMFPSQRTLLTVCLSSLLGGSVALGVSTFHDSPAATAPARPASTPAPHFSVAVRPTDLDVKGHVNNARHLEYLQWARWRWLEDRGLSDESLRTAGTVLVVARVEVDYRAEIRYPDALGVATSAERDSEKRIVFRQKIRRSDGTLAAEAVTTCVAIDPATRKSRPLPESLARLIAESP